MDDRSVTNGDPMRRLEQAVEGALGRIRELEDGLMRSEQRAAELERALFEVSGGDVKPTLLLDRLHALEAENEALRARLERGREGVARVLAKVRFLEERR